MPKIAILTFCVGSDYKKAMQPGIQSKQEYAKKHGYDFHTNGEDVWDRNRPIPWSKLNFILKYLDEYDYLFCSDADAIILQQDVRLEDHVLPLLPAEKDLLWTFDVCNHYNSGHLLIRGRSAWMRDFLKRVYDQTDLMYHIWWENAAVIRLFETNLADRAKIETCMESWKFNSYVFGPKDTAVDPDTRLYKPGDFLVHFAGVYDANNIYRMMKYMTHLASKNIAPDGVLLDTWRRNPPASLKDADESLRGLFL